MDEDDPIKALRELEASGAVTAEQIREAIVHAIWSLDPAQRELLAIQAEKHGRPDIAAQIRHLLQGGLDLPRPQ